MKLSKKLQKMLSLALAVVMVFGMSAVPSQLVQAADTATTTTVAAPNEDVSSGDIVVLYENDVHGAVDGYANIAALRTDMKEKTDYVAVVSAGDFAQGATIGALSKGENIVKIMNKVKYDVITVGNHEFDYTVPQLKKLTDMLASKVVSCNYMNLKTNKTVYPSYTMKKYGDVKVAFVGIATPESITKSTPTYFQNADGKYIYGFCEDSTGKALYKRVQKTVDVAKKAGADYVVALGHLGNEGSTPYWTSTSVIKNTTGIDVLLDGHSHEVYAGNIVKNKDGKNVVLSQTGTKFENIGKLVISKDGKISTQMVSLKDYTKKDAEVSKYIASVKASYEAELSKVIGSTTVDLTTLNPTTGKRAVRNAETNLGDFAADALRTVLDSDIAVMNGGGIRADIKKGDITYKSLIDVFPFGNMGCVMQATGQQIKDALEMSARSYPEENGGFLHVSGMTYEINSAIPSSIKLDTKGMFVGVNGKYRVENIKVLDKKTGKYVKLDTKKKYTLGGINYTLKNGGDGFTMFMKNKVIKDEVAVDNELLITYLTKNLGGVVGSEYANPAGQGRIVIK